MSTLMRAIHGRLRMLLAPSISLIVLLVLWWKADARLDVIARQLGRVDLGILAGALVFSVGWHVFLGADKWWRILRAMGVQVGYWEVFRVRLGSDPIRIAAPLKMGEIVNVAYFARREEFGFSQAAGSVVFDKSLNFFGEVFWLYAGIVALARVPTAGYLALHTAIGVAVLTVFGVRPVRRAATRLAGMLHPKLGHMARGVLSAFEEFSLAQKIGFLSYGAVFQLRPLAVCWLIFLAFEPDRLPTLPEMLVLGSVVVLMSNLPSLGGIGPREATLMTVFASYADPATLLSVGLFMSFLVQVFPAILGVPLMFPLLRELTAANPCENEAN